MSKQPCKPLGWVIRHRDTRLWYSGSSGANQKRIQNWTEHPSLAKRYLTANRADAAGYMIGMVIGEKKTITYLLVQSGDNVHAIRLSSDTLTLVDNNFDLNIRNPYALLDNPVNR
jgi:hypothetical protein